MTFASESEILCSAKCAFKIKTREMIEKEGVEEARKGRPRKGFENTETKDLEKWLKN